MKVAAIAMGIALLAGVGWVVLVRSENHRWRFNHGDGYWSVHELVPNRRGFWERFGHYERLYDGAVDLGLVERFSVAPAGAYAAFARGGCVLLYDRNAGTIDTVTSGGSDPPEFA